MERCKRRSLQPKDVALSAIRVGEKRKPGCIISSVNSFILTPDVQRVFIDSYHLWILLRILSSNDPFVPTFSGWCVQQQSKKINIVEKTVLTYLPPINAP